MLGANDGLVSVASIMLGVGAGSNDRHTLLLSGISALVAGKCTHLRSALHAAFSLDLPHFCFDMMTHTAGALSMAAGEYISVASQKDTELADVDKERQQQEAGPTTRAHELEELAQIYVSRGLDYDLAKKARTPHSTLTCWS